MKLIKVYLLETAFTRIPYLHTCPDNISFCSNGLIEGMTQK